MEDAWKMEGWTGRPLSYLNKIKRTGKGSGIESYAVFRTNFPT